MLRQISIENYALIRSLNIEFKRGFSVITGETGSGKSIILGALGLILGNRADTKVLLNKEKKCIVEGVFNIKNYNLENFFDSYELDYDDNTIIRREINKKGKSRAFINDTPVKINLLKEIGDKLVNIHSQFRTITLNDSNFQLAVIDDYVGHHSLINKYKGKYLHYKKITKILEELIEKEQNSKSDQDYYQFQYDELNNAKLSEDEQKDLEKELEVLNNAEEIKTNLYKTAQLLTYNEINLISSLNEIKGLIDPITKFSDEIKNINERIESNIIDLKDISNEIEGIEDKITTDPKRLEEANERIDLIYHLQYKHRVKSVSDLLQIIKELNDKLQSISSLEDEIRKKSEEMNFLKKDLKTLSQQISKGRKQVLPDIEKKIKNLLNQLGMPDAKFKIDLTQSDDLTSDGVDKVKFLFTANKGALPDDVSRIASGGELSRLMLSIKSLISSKNLLPTIIFDEIDMGVSGDIGNKVGDILLKMADSMQVIAITHLPQIAGKGQNHYLVYKDTDDDLAKSHITEISGDTRIEEIAKMLSGTEITKIAIENAKELLFNN